MQKILSMIFRLSLSNFYSIADEAVLDFMADRKRKSTLPDNLLDFNGNKVVSIIGLFGGNAAGKSNLIKGVAFCRNLVLNSANNIDGSISNHRPFKFENGKSSRFSIEFETEGVEYEYSFELMKGRVLTESLYYYPQKRRAKVFLRENTNGYSYGKGLIQRPTEIETSTGPQTLFLSSGSRMNRPILKKVYKFFKEGLWIETGHYQIDNDTRDLIKSHKPLLLKALEVSDSDIIDFRMVESGPGIPVIQTFHREDPTVAFDFISEESEGTKRLFHILLMLLEKATTDTTIFFDELDLKLHLRLSEFLLDAVVTLGKAQMVFTSHNPSLINRERFRYEQMVMVTKLPKGRSEFVPLSEYEGVSEIKDLQKAYLQGRFDAVPYIGDISSIRKD